MFKRIVVATGDLWGVPMPDMHKRAAVMAQQVEHLASDAMEGRAPGTEGGRMARRFVEDGFADLGLVQAGDDGTYSHHIAAIGGANLIGAIPGQGPRSDRFVMLGAHYDHLGKYFGRVHPGADDNAAGVAVLLDVARQLTELDNLDRTVLICAFDAEEPPYFLTDDMGSVHFVDRPTIDLSQLDAMVCLDLIGHSLGPESLPDEVRRTVFALGAERSGLGAVIDELGSLDERIRPRRLDADVIPPLSDHYAFERAGIPFVFYTTGRDRHYHTPRDTPDRLDYPKMVGFADHITDLMWTLSDGPSLTYDRDAHDDRATMQTLVEIGRHAAPLHQDSDLVSGLIERLEHRLLANEPLNPFDRAGLRSTIIAIETALA